MKSILLLLLSVFIGPFSSADENSQLFSCLKSLAGVSYGKSFLIDDKFVLKPSSKGDGFYLFSEDKSSFCKFPAKSGKSNEKYDYFFLKFTISGKPTYLTYSKYKKDITDPGIGYSSFPLQAIEITKFLPDKAAKMINEFGYVAPVCSPDAKASEVLKQEILASLSTVYTSYLQEDEYLSDMSETASKDRYFAALEKCEMIKDQKFQDVITKQRLAFAPRVDKNGKFDTGDGKKGIR